MFFLLAFYEGSLIESQGCDLPTLNIQKKEYHVIPLGTKTILCQKKIKKVERRINQVGRVVVAKNFLEYDSQTIKRIEEEKKLLETIYNNRGHIFFDTTANPLNSITTVSPFGKTREYGEKLKIFKKFFTSMHTGVDLRASEKTKIYSIGKGVVVFAGDLFFTGKTVIIAHGFEVFSLYAHLSKIHITKDQFIEKKTLLGFAGKTGRVSGPHLHFAIKVKGFWIDPLEFLKMFK